MNALNDTIRETYPTFHKKLDVSELVTGNILPNAHFRDWASASYPDKYGVTNATAVASTTAATFWGGGKSAKVTASAANGYMSVKSDDYPALLDLMNHEISAYVWASPEVADDASVVIYTKNAAGSTQTLTSTTATPAGEFTLIKLEDQSLNDDLVECEIRFKVATNTKYVHFDHARVIGQQQHEYLLPTDFANGHVSSVEVQTSSYSDYACDDLRPRSWETVYDWEIVDDGTDKYLRFGNLPVSGRLIRLIGITPLSTVSAYTDTIEIDGELINRFTAYAKYKLYQAIEGPVASSDIGRYELQSAKAYGEYQRLGHIRMSQPKTTMRIREY